MLTDFLSPIEDKSIYEPHQMGSAVKKYVGNFPSLTNMQIAIIGVAEGRASNKNKETSLASAQVRKEFYRLATIPGVSEFIIDLGDIKPGANFSDTEAALEHVAKTLREEGLILLVIGGSDDLGYSLYKSQEGVSANLDLTYVSSHLPILPGQMLSKICEHQPNYLFNINALGIQSHYIPSSGLEIMNKLGFNQLRLGQLKSNTEEAEPLIRNTNLFLFNVSAIKQGDAPANYYSNPNGVEGDLACKLCWYAGVSDLANVFGIFEMNPEFDYRNQTAKLVAQMSWYFVDGYRNRVKDHPEHHQEFVRYRCNIESKNPDLVFYKSKRTSRWWMEIPNPKSLSNPDKNVIVPCSYADYQVATTGDLPERYLKTLQKMH